MVFPDFFPKTLGFRIRPFLLMNNNSSSYFCKNSQLNRAPGPRAIGPPKSKQGGLVRLHDFQNAVTYLFEEQSEKLLDTSERS